MRIAILISGHCRTFVFQEQKIFFENFLKSKHSVDIYLMLKIDSLMQSEQGLNNLKEMIKTLKPKYSIAFKEWRENNQVYYSQMKMIQFLANKAMPNKYDYYIRMRPDGIILNTLDEILNEISNEISNTLCTSYKFDAKGNDQFFIMTHSLLENWLFKLPMYPSIYKNLPDYTIFNEIQVKQCIKSGLVRSYERIESWNNYHCHLNISYWISRQQFIPIAYDDFINKLKNIIHYEVVL